MLPKLSKTEIDAILEKEPRFNDIQLSLLYGPKLPKVIVQETKEAIAIARKFNEEVVKPRALEYDRKIQEDPEWIPMEFIEEATRWGFYSMWLPRIFGGQGYNMASQCYFLEEICSCCVGLGNCIGVHYLGIGACSVSFNYKMLKKLCEEVLENERMGKPCYLCAALTEPSAGTDAEEMELLGKGRVSCTAKKVDGGYIISGSKVFISMGPVSTWAALTCYEDIADAPRTMISLMVHKETETTPGFKVGRIERKMGQKACPVGELIFDDVFVPDENCIMCEEGIKNLERGAVGTNQQVLDYILCVTRPCVGAFGTGCARGAYESALEYCSETEIDGELMINYEWVQQILGEMYKNVALGRLSYVEANYASGLYGIFRDQQKKGVFYFLKYAPRKLLDKLAEKATTDEAVEKTIEKGFSTQTPDETATCAGWASICKLTGTDAGMRNSQLAVELMGQAGVRQDARAEKFLRDSKLLQIYEGSNQLNRLHLFNNLVSRACPEKKHFHDTEIASLKAKAV